MDETTAIIIGVLVVVMAIVVFLELRFLRKKAGAARVKRAKDSGLPDEAHNALVTTRAIVAALERSGIRTDEVSGLMQEAQMAVNRRNYRVAIELTEKVKGRLMALKAAQASKGDLAKLDVAQGRAGDEPTTKERLQKDFPANLAPAKFALGVAEGSIVSGRSAGRDTSAAETLLAQARVRFDSKDYDGALRTARLAQKSAEGQAVDAAAAVPPPTPKAVPVSSLACASCGAPLKEDDAFCRKCGTKVAPRACPACSAPLLADDMFCRKCGTRLLR